MAHVSKQLLDAVTSAVTGLATTGSNVQQSRVYAHSVAPSLSLRLGERRTLQILSGSILDAEQDIYIDIHVAGSADSIDDQLLAIEAEVHRALMASPQLGLGCVLDVDPQGLSEPELAQGEQPKAVATASWRYKIRHNLSDPEQ